jgi:hypothetical protein
LSSIPSAIYGCVSPLVPAAKIVINIIVLPGCMTKRSYF